MLRIIILVGIRLYWLIPAKKRRKCIFNESCSIHVYKKAQENGFISGLKALKTRFKQCRSGYIFYTSPDKKEWCILVDQSIVPKDDIRQNYKEHV